CARSEDWGWFAYW
nr:immunoglobulin heavy chain junction region [Mus musculus]